MGTGTMQAVIHSRQRQPEEGRDVLMRAIMDEGERSRFAQSVRQFGNGGERGVGLPALLKDIVGQGVFVGDALGLRERRQGVALAPKLAKGMVANDAAQPAGKSRRLLKARQRRPGRNEG